MYMYILYAPIIQFTSERCKQSDKISFELSRVFFWINQVVLGLSILKLTTIETTISAKFFLPIVFPTGKDRFHSKTKYLCHIFAGDHNVYVNFIVIFHNNQQTFSEWVVFHNIRCHMSHK